MFQALFLFCIVCICCCNWCTSRPPRLAIIFTMAEYSFALEFSMAGWLPGRPTDCLAGRLSDWLTHRQWNTPTLDAPSPLVSCHRFAGNRIRCICTGMWVCEGIVTPPVSLPNGWSSKWRQEEGEDDNDDDWKHITLFTPSFISCVCIFAWPQKCN